MHPDDQKRLDLERAIANARRGPDYSLLDEDLRTVRAYNSKRDSIADAAYAREEAGYYEGARNGEYRPRTQDGSIVPFHLVRDRTPPRSGR